MAKALIRLIRLPNLIIIAITQYLMRHMIIEPFLRVNDFSLQMDHFHFALLVFSTVAIAAAGYAINDYFDSATDRVNRLEKVVIDTKISRQTAIKIHAGLSLAGTLAGIYLSFYIGVSGLSIVFLMASGLLWFYSIDFKRRFLVGNLVVSVLTAFVPLLVVLFELPLLNKEYGDIMLTAGENFTYIFYWISAFAFFAFIMNLIREIIKDSEDLEGDVESNMNTLAIALGTGKTRFLLVGLLLFFLIVFSLVIYRYLLFSSGSFDWLSASYFSLTIYLPVFLLIFRISVAKNKRDYHIASQILKFIMLFGVLYSLIVWYKVNFSIN